MNEIAVPNFDYAALDPEVRRIVKDASDEIHGAHDRQVDEALRTGRALIRVKEALPHGEFGPWLSHEFGWSERTAQNYMRAAETFGENPQRVSDLPLRAVYQLASPSTPDTARHGVLERLERGERPTEREVARIIECEKKERKERKAEAIRAQKEEAELAAMTPEERKLTQSKKARREAQQRAAARAAAKDRAKWDAEQQLRQEAARHAAEFIVDRLGEDCLVLRRMVEGMSPYALGAALLAIAVNRSDGEGGDDQRGPQP